MLTDINIVCSNFTTQALHIVLVPFTTAFYNIVALVGLFPALEVVEKKTYHHLRYDWDAWCCLLIESTFYT